MLLNTLFAWSPHEWPGGTLRATHSALLHRSARPFAAAADNIKAQGGKPTARSVRDALGTGSMATVLKFLQEWKGGQVRQCQAIDDTLDPSIARAISNQIAGKVQEATADATARLADLQAETDGVIVENELDRAELVAERVKAYPIQPIRRAMRRALDLAYRSCPAFSNPFPTTRPCPPL